MSALAAAVALTVAVAVPATAQAKGQKQPNLVLFTSDDQPLSTFTKEWMPKTFRELVGRGTNFTDAVVNEPLCCPSRATILTGQYGHNHGILTNTTGYPALVDPKNVLPSWLGEAGYRTGHFGKWLHGYESVRGAKPAPGWNRWVTQQDKRRYYGYKVSVDGKLVRKGSRPRDHVTAVTTRAAANFVKQNVKARKPLFLQVDYFAPHESDASGKGRCAGSAEPLARDKGAAAGAEAPRDPSFNEEDVSDKPQWARLGAMTEKEIKGVDRHFRCMAEAMRGVDRGIKSVVDRFRRAGELGNTAFVFMTDNGLFLGQHRVRIGKSRPWEEAIRTPLALRLPRSAGKQRDSVGAQVAAIDVAPTLLELAGAEPCIRADRCRILDGRSLVAPATGDASGFRDRAVLIEMEEEPSDFTRSWACAFTAIRTSGEILVASSQIPDPGTRVCRPGQSFEYYDLAQDPYQLINQVSDDPLSFGPAPLQMLARLSSIARCNGIEGRDPATPGGYCE